VRGKGFVFFFTRVYIVMENKLLNSHVFNLFLRVTTQHFRCTLEHRAKMLSIKEKACLQTAEITNDFVENRSSTVWIIIPYSQVKNLTPINFKREKGEDTGKHVTLPKWASFNKKIWCSEELQILIKWWRVVSFTLRPSYHWYSLDTWMSVSRSQSKHWRTAKRGQPANVSDWPVLGRNSIKYNTNRNNSGLPVLAFGNVDERRNFF
jgi:hypothetical protein